MNLIQLAIHRPIAVIAAVLMTLMFGWLALETIPVQLAPDVNKPVITITTGWFGASPVEVERELINKQEEVLQGLEGLSEMSSSSNTNVGTINLEFDIGTNMDRALLLVSNRLGRVTGYPEEADEPILQAAGANDNPIAWFILQRLEGNTRAIHEYGDFAEEVVQARLERVAGIGKINVFGGAEQDMQIVVQPQKLARYGITIAEMVTRLRAANISLTAGYVDEGKRRYTVRAEAELDSTAAVGQVVLRSVADPVSGTLARVTVADVADIQFGHKEPQAKIRFLGDDALAINGIRQSGANVIETMASLKLAVEELNQTTLPDAQLRLYQVYDETIYIESAIDLVQQNIYVGGALAAFILILFLRSLGATFVISIAIPVSVVGSFVAMAAMGRSINVISLAGIAFAVGMVVDAAIVVLENIFRLRQQGKTATEAAYEGAAQVWGAILVSALTTVMVFIPLLTLELEVGQLFRDIAVAISVAVVLSLLVAVTVIPALSRKVLGRTDYSKVSRGIPGLDHFGRGFTAAVVGFTKVITRSWLLSLLVVAGLSAGAGWVTYNWLPDRAYLPDGNRNLAFGLVFPPPGYNLETTTEIAKNLEDEVRPLWTSETGTGPDPEGRPKMDIFFFVALREQAFIGADAHQPERAAELVPILRTPLASEPGTFAFVKQYPLFGQGLGGSSSIQLDISGDHLESLFPIAGQAMGMMFGNFPGSEGFQTIPKPRPQLGAPEIRVLPNRVRLADAGVSATEFALSLDAYNDGLRVDEITVGSKRMDLMLTGPDKLVAHTQGLADIPLISGNGSLLPARNLGDLVPTAGPISIRHVERKRTVTLELSPPQDQALQPMMAKVNSAIIEPLKAQGLPADIDIQLSGSARKLEQTLDAMQWQLIVAMIIVYLVMAVLFESFVYPLVILVSVPLATAGAVLGLATLNEYIFQPLDMLTLLGFVILIGIVVNNAILLVHQTLHHIREDAMPALEAIWESTQNRIRPIFMSTLTSVVGMLPLVLFPGAGSELYRGLGTVVVGGLALSAILTLALIPPLMALVFRIKPPAASQ